MILFSLTTMKISYEMYQSELRGEKGPLIVV